MLVFYEFPMTIDLSRNILLAKFWQINTHESNLLLVSHIVYCQFPLYTINNEEQLNLNFPNLSN